MSNETVNEIVSGLPSLHPDEKAELEQLTGRELTNDQAQELLFVLREWDMYMDFVEKGYGRLR